MRIENKKRKLTQFILLVIVLAAFAYFIASNYEDFRSIQINNWVYLVPISLLFLLYIGVNAYTMNLILRKLGADIKLSESYGLSAINSLGNLILPLRGGMVSTAVYLKKKYSVGYSNFVLLISAIYIIVFLINSITGILSLIYINSTTGQFSTPIFLFLCVVSIALLGIIIFAPKLNETQFSLLTNSSK